MDLMTDGMTKVAWVTSIANLSAPTAAECNGGFDWTFRITPDGLKTDPQTADVDNSSLGSTFDTTDVGRTGYTVEVTFKRGTTPTEDQPYTTLTKKTAGYLVIRRNADCTTAFATGDLVEVYPVKAGEGQNVAPAKNEVAKFMVPFKLYQEPKTRATVA